MNQGALCSLAASALVTPRQTSLTARLKIFFMRAYLVTFFTVFLAVSATLWMACLAVPTT